jgi:hypothetical protein
MTDTDLDEEDVRSGLGETNGDGLADSTGSACDQGCLSFE